MRYLTLESAQEYIGPSGHAENTSMPQLPALVTENLPRPAWEPTRLSPNSRCLKPHGTVHRAIPMVGANARGDWGVVDRGLPDQHVPPIERYTATSARSEV